MSAVPHGAEGTSLDGPAAVEEFITHHVTDQPEWHLPFLEQDFSGPLSVHGMMVVLGGVFLVLIGCMCKKSLRSPSRVQSILEYFVIFIRDQISIPALGKEDGRKLAPLFCTFFAFIFMLNLMGMIPLFSAATSNYNVTLALALITLFFMIFGAIYKNGVVGFFKAFVPPGVPWPILILITPLEFLSMFIRTFALMIRLFANIFAGHIVVLCMFGMVVVAETTKAKVMSIAFFGTLAFLMTIFELVIVVPVQALMFTLLSAVFIGLTYHPSH